MVGTIQTSPNVLMYGGHHTHFTRFTHVWWAQYTLHQMYLCMVGTIHTSPNVLMYVGHHTHFTKCIYVWWAPYTLHQIYPCMVGTIHTSPNVLMYGVCMVGTILTSQIMYEGHPTYLSKTNYVWWAPFFLSSFIYPE